MSLKRTRHEIKNFEINTKPIKKFKFDKSLQTDKNDDEKTDQNAEKRLCINDCYLLVVDTEVHDWREGKKDKISGADPESRITQIAWTMYSKKGQKIKTKSYYIRPDGWKITKKATKYTKITQETLESKGISIGDALYRFNNDYKMLLKNNGFITAHHYSYDAAMIMHEIERYQYAHQYVNQYQSFKELLKKLNSFATIENRIIDTHSLDFLKELHRNSSFTEAVNAVEWIVQEKLRLWSSRTIGASLGCLHQVVCGGDKYKLAHNAEIDVELCAELIYAAKSQYNIDLFT